MNPLLLSKAGITFHGWAAKAARGQAHTPDSERESSKKREGGYGGGEQEKKINNMIYIYSQRPPTWQNKAMILLWRYYNSIRHRQINSDTLPPQIPGQVLQLQ